MAVTPRPGGLRIARILGVPIFVHVSWVLVFALLTWTLATGYFPLHDPGEPVWAHWAKGFVASLLLFVSILLHEISHAVVALRHGIRVRSMTLFVFGGVAQFDADPSDGRTELRVAAAGPLSSLGLAALFLLVAAIPGLWAPARGVSQYLGLVNLALALFNLVPAFPLDGGRILRGLLWGSMGKLQATRLATGAGTLFAWLLVGFGVVQLVGGQAVAGLWYVVIGWFLKEAAEGAYRGVRLDETLHGVMVEDAMLTEVASIPAHITLAEAAQDYFMRTGYGAYPVVRNDAPVGLLCLRDVLRLPVEEREAMSVQAVMAPLSEALTIEPAAPLLQAMAKMAHGPGRLLVMREGRLVGFLTMSAVVRQMRVRQALSG
jgi:Zn-dependent protease/predicted transcriptional regulator